MKANEAPEKLYLSKNIYSTFLYQVPDHDDGTAVEYIRKDALLEWAKIKQTQCLENSTAHAYFQMFIDKINCM